MLRAEPRKMMVFSVIVVMVVFVSLGTSSKEIRCCSYCCRRGSERSFYVFVVLGYVVKLSRLCASFG